MIFDGGASPSSPIIGGELERAKWAMAALRLLTYHTLGDPLTYTVCIPILYAPLNTRRTILLLAYLYKSLDGSNLNALMGLIKIATDHLLAVLAVDPDLNSVQTTEIQIKEAARAIQRASTPEGVQVSTLPSPHPICSSIFILPPPFSPLPCVLHLHCRTMEGPTVTASASLTTYL